MVGAIVVKFAPISDNSITTEIGEIEANEKTTEKS